MRFKYLLLFIILYRETSAQQSANSARYFGFYLDSDSLAAKETSDPYRSLENKISDTSQWLAFQKELVWDYDKGIAPEISTDDKYQNARYWGYPIKSRNSFIEIYRYLEFLDEEYNSEINKFDDVYIGNQLNETPSLLVKKSYLEANHRIAIYDASISSNNDNVAIVYKIIDSLTLDLRIVTRNQKVLADHLVNLENHCIAWYKDGFFYTKRASINSKNHLYNEDNIQKIFYHSLGEPQSADKLVFHRNTYPINSLRAFISYDERHLFISDYNKDKDTYTIISQNLIDSMGSVRLIIGPLQYPIIPLEVYDNFMYCVSRPQGLENGQIDRLDLSDSVPSPKTIIPAMEDARIINSQVVKDKIIVKYLNGNRYTLVIYDLLGKTLHRLNMDQGFSCDLLSTAHFDTAIYLRVFSPVAPPVVYSINLNTYKIKLNYQAEVDYNIHNYSTKFATCRSNDSAVIPLTIFYNSKIKYPNNSKPALIEVSSGFGNLNELRWSERIINFLDKGGVLIVANIRGGVKVGTDWHKEGMAMNKEKCVNDIEACVQYVINQKISDSNRIAIIASYDGALAVANLVLKKPNLIKACVLYNAPLDLLNYDRLTNSGHLRREYGFNMDSVHRNRLLALSPYQNININRTYPSMLLIADRWGIFPAEHSIKFVSRMQRDLIHKSPCLFFLTNTYEKMNFRIPFPNRYKNYWRFIYNELKVKY